MNQLLEKLENCASCYDNVDFETNDEDYYRCHICDRDEQSCCCPEDDSDEYKKDNGHFCKGKLENCASCCDDVDSETDEEGYYGCRSCGQDEQSCSCAFPNIKHGLEKDDCASNSKNEEYEEDGDKYVSRDCLENEDDNDELLFNSSNSENDEYEKDGDKCVFSDCSEDIDDVPLKLKFRPQYGYDNCNAKEVTSTILRLLKECDSAQFSREKMRISFHLFSYIFENFSIVFDNRCFRKTVREKLDQFIFETENEKKKKDYYDCLSKQYGCKYPYKKWARAMDRQPMMLRRSKRLRY